MSGFLDKITSLLKGSTVVNGDIPTLYTLSGCIKCRQVKKYMQENALPFLEKDANKGAKKEFQKFHMDHFNDFVRGPKGCISFPIYVQGDTMYQGIANVLAHLRGGEKLKGYFSVGFQHFEWIDGIHISGGDPEQAEEFLWILRYLRKHDFKLQVDTTGKNSSLLKQIRDENLADLLIMNVLGPRELYQIAGETIDPEEIGDSMVLTTGFPKYRFQTSLVPDYLQEEGNSELRYLTPDEIGATALLIKEATAGTQHPYLLILTDPEGQGNKTAKIDALEPGTLKDYLAAAKVHLEQTEFEAENL